MGDTPLRIAFSGPAGSGKTTHARLMQKAFGGDVLSFATPLKKLVKDLFGDKADDEAFFREAQQQVGMVVRNIDRETWIRLLLAKVSPNRGCYVDDCRFYNEFVALRQMGFVAIRLAATPGVLAERRPGMSEAQRRHESEVEAAQIPGDIVALTDDQEEAVHTRLVELLSARYPLKRK